MKDIPKEKVLDSTLGLARDGFKFIQKRCWEHRSDIFQTRLMGQKAICMTGEEASRLFYDNEKFIRKGSTPKRIQKTLFGQGGVQSLDDDAHKNRKEMFMTLMGPAQRQELLDLVSEQWALFLDKWPDMEQVVLYTEAQKLLTKAICAWAGVPLKDEELELRAKDFGAMIDAFGAIGPRHWRGRSARTRAEKWISELIEQVRNGELMVSEQKALHVFAFHKEIDGKQLSPRVAAVEIINVLRPTVAIARFVSFAALALHEHPEFRQRLQENGDDYVKAFVHEVRRYYPFAPMLGARVREDFEWRGYKFPKGRLVVLYLYGTDHDSRTWDNPEAFFPQRFLLWKDNAYNFIPQGGGEHHTGHRCAGEWITIEVLMRSVKFLTRNMNYEVPKQDLSVDLTRMPTFPKSLFVITNVESRGDR